MLLLAIFQPMRFGDCGSSYNINSTATKRPSHIEANTLVINACLFVVASRITYVLKIQKASFLFFCPNNCIINVSFFSTDVFISLISRWLNHRRPLVAAFLVEMLFVGFEFKGFSSCFRSCRQHFFVCHNTGRAYKIYSGMDSLVAIFRDGADGLSVINTVAGGHDGLNSGSFSHMTHAPNSLWTVPLCCAANALDTIRSSSRICT